MDLAVNRSPLNHDMSTDGVGTILSGGRGTLNGKDGEPVGREARNASRNPSEFMPGVQGDIGVMDPDNNCGW